MYKPHVLIVEDEAHIRRFVRIALEKAGMVINEAGSVEAALIDSASRRPEVIIVDLGLPDGDGKDFIREVRSWSEAPIVVLSAREDEKEKVEALDAGADDYLTKPFGVPELLARVRAQLRRIARINPAQGAFYQIHFGDVCVDMTTCEVTKGGSPVHLTRTELRLLTTLAQGEGKVLTHRQLLQEVWGAGSADRLHYLRIYMANLRRKLEDDPARPKHLITELQVGYRFAGLKD
ncbi:MAG: response regulator [Candidatus Pacebacteria bacterium]|nr:response regulator [Candidatus Paceibacterota bacterium]